MTAQHVQDTRYITEAEVEGGYWPRLLEGQIQAINQHLGNRDWQKTGTVHITLHHAELFQGFESTIRAVINVEETK